MAPLGAGGAPPWKSKFGLAEAATGARVPASLPARAKYVLSVHLLALSFRAPFRAPFRVPFRVPLRVGTVG